jgi:hypothetical protein
MKTLAMMACLLLSPSLFGEQNCVKNARGKTVCSDGNNAAAVNPNTGKATVAQKNQNGVTTVQMFKTTKAAKPRPKTEWA